MSKDATTVPPIDSTVSTTGSSVVVDMAVSYSGAVLFISVWSEPDGYDSIGRLLLLLLVWLMWLVILAASYS